MLRKSSKSEQHTRPVPARIPGCKKSAHRRGSHTNPTRAVHAIIHSNKHTCSELQCPTPRHPTNPSGLSLTARRQERPSGIALLFSSFAPRSCEAADCFAARPRQGSLYIMDSIFTAHRSLQLGYDLSLQRDKKSLNAHHARGLRGPAAERAEERAAAQEVREGWIACTCVADRAGRENRRHIAAATHASTSTDDLIR